MCVSTVLVGLRLAGSMPMPITPSFLELEGWCVSYMILICIGLSGLKVYSDRLALCYSTCKL